MKKILVTTLALSLSAASTVDARVRNAQPSAINTKQVAVDTKDMLAQKKSGDIKNCVKTAKNVVDEIGQDEASSELFNINKSIAAKEDEIRALQASRDNIKTGWFGRWTNTEYKTADNDVKKAQDELRDLKRRQGELTGEVGSSTARVIKAAALATTAVAVAAGIADWYYDLGYAKAGYARGKEMVSAGYAKGQEYYGRARASAASATQQAKGAAFGAYNRLVGKATQTVEPVATPTVEQVTPTVEQFEYTPVLR